MRTHSILRRPAATLVGAALAATAAAPAAHADAVTGPSSSERPYVLPSQPGVVSRSILTVGDQVPRAGGGDYRLVGIPDGLGALRNGDGTFTLLAGHELGSTAGTVRAHGATGAFVSRWTIRRGDLAVREGGDLIRRIATWNAGASAYDAPATGVALNRLCSATLAPASAFFDAATGRGYDGRLLTDGEEGGPSRAFAHALDGTSYELPALGRLAFENVVPRPGGGEATVVVATDDSSPGQVYVYKGAKTATGSPVERAGLTNGSLYGIKVAGVADESRDAGIPPGTPFTLAPLGDVRGRSAAELESAGDGAGVTRFLRPEDGAWDPTDPDVFWFVTTDRFGSPASPGRSRLWRLTFADGSRPELGGTIDEMLDGTEGQQMLDNITVNGRGQVLIQEDPGNQPYLARIWLYSPRADRLVEVAHFDPERFAPGAASFLTQDEESSGIVDASQELGAGWYLLDVQAHYGIPGELVEGGQLLALHVPYGRYPS